MKTLNTHIKHDKTSLNRGDIDLNMFNVILEDKENFLLCSFLMLSMFVQDPIHFVIAIYCIARWEKEEHS